ncbi:hypothetical protein [Parvicella tangerina]|uniref:Uncharacterized protein n=1 Tax=Parvicella tangerina TaxID=2829795 RepID=A0A916JMS1_9FLAO|nr:hypothetical protein [Parvicella tangerina]CAG5081355.1 hypothetical protein CRYO30217_01605 [Parvicella tangerina]
MKSLLPFLLFVSTLVQAKNLDILQCLELVDFKPDQFASGDFPESLDQIEPIIDLKNGYYEISKPELDITYIQAAKYNNADGSITLMITGYEYDMVCERYNTRSFLIFPSGDKYIEMGMDELNLTKDYNHFLHSDELNSILENLLQQLKGRYLSSDATIIDLHRELYDFHYILPRKGTALTISLTVCDYIPTNEAELSMTEWKIITSSIPVLSFNYDKKFIRFIE